jgi:hypothetical protein
MASREESIRKVLEQKGIPFDYKIIQGAALDGEIPMDLADEAMEYFEEEIAEDQLNRIKSPEVLMEDPNALRRELARRAEEERLPGEMYRALGFDETGYPLRMSTFERLEAQLKSLLKDFQDYRNRPSNFEKMMEQEEKLQEDMAREQREIYRQIEEEDAAQERFDREYNKKFDQPLPKIPEGGDAPGGGL